MSSDFNKLDKIRETKLVTAIQKAASLSKVSDKPQHQILAEQLKSGGFDYRFAKVATGAYNKRKTIDHMTSNPQQTRGGSFAIVDADAVAQAMGRVSKTASVVTTGLVFKYTAAAPALQKTASATDKRTALLPMQYTHSMSVQQLQQRLDKCVNKLASQVESQMHQIRRMSAARDARMQKVARVLEAHPNGYEALDAAVAATGPQIVSMLSRYIEDLPSITKAAGYRAPDQKLHQQLVGAYTQAMQTQEQLQDKYETLELMGKVASTIDEIEKHFVDQILCNGLDKTAGGFGSMITTVPATALMAGLSTVQGSLGAAQAMMPLLDQVTSGPGKIDPKQYITPRFIVDERQLAHTMALSDMLADKQLAKQYGVYDISRAFNKLLQVSPEFQRPTRRQALRSQLRTMLAQGGKLSTADVAAARKMVQSLKDQAGIVSSMLKTVDQNLPVQQSNSQSQTAAMAKALVQALAGKDTNLSRQFLKELDKKLEAQAKKKKDDDQEKKKKKKGGNGGQGQPPNLGGKGQGNGGGGRGKPGGNQGGGKQQGRGGQGAGGQPGQLGQPGQGTGHGNPANQAVTNP